MLIEEHNCVGCPPSVGGCNRATCPYWNTKYYECDICGQIAEYRIDDDDFCADCVKDEIFKSLKENLDIDELINIERIEK